MATGGGPGRGFGRGGRGAALLQALAQQERPGQSEEKQNKEKPISIGRAAVQAPMGRGALFRQVQSEQSEPKPGPPSFMRGTGSGDVPPRPVGRGLAAMKAMLAQQQSEQPQMPTPSSGRGFGQSQQQSEQLRMPTGSSGRGFRLAQQQQQQQQAEQPPLATASSGRGFGRPSVPQVAPTSPTQVPTEQMSKMSVTETTTTGEAESYRFKERKRMPTVTRRGTDGNPVSLAANYVRVLCKNEGVYLYYVKFSPIIDNKRLKMRLLAEHKELFKTVNSFDGNVMYLPYKLPDNETVVTSTRKTDGEVITITVTFVKVVPPEQCCHLYNVVFRRIMHILEMCQVGRYYYNPHTPASIPHRKLEVWPGYITAIKEHEGGLLLLLDASHRVLRTETVHDIMEQAACRNPSGFHDEIVKKVVGCTVLTRYNNKTYKVDDIVWSKNPMDRFECRATGESMSFDDYYRKQHNIVIKNKTQPLLLHKRKPPKGAPPDFKLDPEYLCLIPELCYVSGLTDDIRNDHSIMKDLAIHTRVTPAQRQTAMKKFINSVNKSPEAKAELAVWGLELDSSLAHVDGRQLPMEKILFRNKEVMSGQQADWGREATRNELVSPVNLVNWGVFYTRKDASKANDFIRCMQAETKNMGISCQVPFRRELVNEKIDTLVQELRQSINERVQMAVVINPTSRDDRYAAIKKVCCVEVPVPSQVIIAKTISRPDKLRSVVQKIALQINCKLGGELWAVKIPLQKLMVIGIDSYHDAAKGKQSIGGFVASMNRECTRWFSNVCFQRPGQELVQGLQICFTAALKKYHTENHFLPEKIVIYRDGVGDGQLDILADHEVKQLQRCFSTFGENYTPQCTTVCVQKRINTRIYGRDRDGSMINPPPGTVVDSTVTRRDRYDFFIVSQHVRQGTVSPTHYIVVEDGLDLTPGQMQRLTYKMTHLYYNWPGTVRVPAPCQYAHKLAYLVGESIHKEPAECLSDRLFFL